MDELYRDLENTTQYDDWTVDSILAEFRVNDMLDTKSAPFPAGQEENTIDLSIENAPADMPPAQARGDISMDELDAALAALGISFDDAPAAEPVPAPALREVVLQDSFEPAAEREEYDRSPDGGEEPEYAAATAQDIPTDFNFDGSRVSYTATEDMDFDYRFNLGGRRKNSYFYDGLELDTSAEEGYVRARGDEDSISYYSDVDKNVPTVDESAQTEEAADEEQPAPEGEQWAEDEQPELSYPKKRERAFGFGKKKKAKVTAAEIPTDAQQGDLSEGYYDYDMEGDYAPKRSYAPASEVDYSKEFPSFFEFYKGELGTFLLRFRGSGETAGGAAADEGEKELGAEVDADFAARYYGSHIYSLRQRLRICIGVLLILTYISVGLPMTGMLKTLPVRAAVCLGLQLCIMLTCLDVVTGAAVNMARGRFGADCLAVLACVLTSIDALAVALEGFGSSHTPLCVLSSLSLTGVLAASLYSARGLRKTMRVPAIAKVFYSVSGQRDLHKDGTTLIKEPRYAKGFIHRCEETPPDEDFFCRYSLFIIAAVLLITMIICAVRKSFGDALFVFTAVLCPAVPAAALLCFSLPFCIGAVRIFSNGAAIAGWSGLRDLGGSRSVIVTDTDLFPEGTVKITNIMFSEREEPRDIISYAGSMITASNSGLASCFAKTMEENNCSFKQVENFEIMPGGGMRGVIDGHTILCGGLEFTLLMHIQLPDSLFSEKNKKVKAVFLAVDGVLGGYFPLQYEAQPLIRRALINLTRGGRNPVFAVRDFNITPEMLGEYFDIATDGYNFPSYSERYALSEAKAGKDSRVSALVCQDGLFAYARTVNAGRSMYIATVLNLLLMLFSALLGVLIVMTKLLSVGTFTVASMLVFMLLWLIPVYAVSAFMKT